LRETIEKLVKEAINVSNLDEVLENSSVMKEHSDIVKKLETSHNTRFDNIWNKLHFIIDKQDKVSSDFDSRYTKIKEHM